MAKVLIPTSLRSTVGGNRELEFPAQTVGELLGLMSEQFPELDHHLFDEDGKLVSFMNLFVNDENIRDRDDLATPLGESDEVLLVPAIAGG